MKLKYYLHMKVILFFCIYLLLGNSSTKKDYQRSPEDKTHLLISLIKYILEKRHFNYSKDSINDNLSKKIFKSFLEKIDNRKLFLTQEDLAKFKIYETQIDNQINDHKLDFFNSVTKTLSEKIPKQKSIYKEILSKPFNFELENDSIKNGFLDLYAKDEQGLKEKWTKYLKYRTLDILYEKIKENGSNNFDSLEIESRKIILDLHKSWFDVFESNKRNNWLSIYINSFIENFDPHTYYFAPKEKKKFNENMSGHIEGIGAVLSQRQGYITVEEVVYGGPAWKQGELEVGDKIIKAIQGNDKKDPGVDLVGMLSQDAVEFIKGKKGTQVTLYVKKTNKINKYITITRDIVELKKTFAKSSIIKKNNNLYGYILLPKFYSSFDKNKIRSSAGDIKKELNDLNKQNIKGLILDLRYNGGGYLIDAIKIAGFFIDKGPIVQVRSKENEIEVLSDEDPSILYKGNLIILVNQFSASASEILASALLDYNRAIVVGTNHTFGKGTVQSMIDLNRSKVIKSPIGSIKITTQKFYRVNGDGTQLKGLTPQIIIPNRHSHTDYGEKEEKNALKWDKIKSAKIKKFDKNDKFFSKAKEKSIKRISKNKYIRSLKDKIDWINKENKNTNIPLNLKKYSQYQHRLEDEIKKFDIIDKYDSKLNFMTSKYDSIKFDYDTVLINQKVKWGESLSKDIYISESVNILEDLNL